MWKATFYVGSLRNQILKINMKSKVTLIRLYYYMLITQYSLQKMATIWEVGFLIPLPKTLTCLKILLTVSINWSVSANSKMFLTLSRMVPWWTIMHLAGEALFFRKRTGILEQRWVVVLFQTGKQVHCLHEVWCGRQWWCCATRGSCMCGSVSKEGGWGNKEEQGEKGEGT